MSIWFVLNVFFAWIMLKWARRDFENGHNGLGWMNIVFSAWNAAAAANAIFEQAVIQRAWVVVVLFLFTGNPILAFVLAGLILMFTS
jgi:hypothetical protein